MIPPLRPPRDKGAEEATIQPMESVPSASLLNRVDRLETTVRRKTWALVASVFGSF
jgi:hypothetical protein